MEVVGMYFPEIVSALLTGGVGTFFGWFFTRRKTNADATTTEINNGAEVVKLYKDALDDLPHRYQNKFDGLNELFDQKSKILNEEIEFLKKERDLWKRKYNDLLKEYRNYKKDHP